ncbi:hypothetical protein [Pseudomonas sp. 6D_7.1_Bac1]|uniref:hypothetical protein n=1 Tax=Pseudomonas sp. 6D_7.1_Bac1 TaxID=2971615 RepID=UPI0021C7D025|nr:hypothetical protein [Pseudomonas sp. 6D_7.1_Bac1]MCU1748621.1 hypothetical protein [Pseudomonas sp. 6D_7.1_Bac1]
MPTTLSPLALLARHAVNPHEEKRFSYRASRRYTPYEHILLASKNNNLPAN